MPPYNPKSIHVIIKQNVPDGSWRIAMPATGQPEKQNGRGYSIFCAIAGRGSTARAAGQVVCAALISRLKCPQGSEFLSQHQSRKKYEKVPQKSLVHWRKISDTLGFFQFLDDNSVHLIRIVNCAAKLPGDSGNDSK